MSRLSIPVRQPRGDSPVGPSTAVRGSWLAACLVLVAATAGVQAQTTGTAPFEPVVGQQGKDVVWVPTSQVLVDTMLDMAGVTPEDYVIDLGSGDGRTVITAAKRGARALGVEYNPDMVTLSKQNAEKEGVANRATFVEADLFETDFSEATVVTMFLLPDINLRLRPKILDLEPGTRIVSNTFTMEDWEADETQRVQEGCTSWCTALFWVVPAKVTGTWRLPQGELTLDQEFQMIAGTLKTGDGVVPISGRMRGEAITFTAGDREYSGRVNGNAMEGTVGGAAWTATRAGQP